MAHRAIHGGAERPVRAAANGAGRVTLMWYEREFFVHSRPRKAKGGIKAQSKRGTFGESWWARRWITVLESFDIGARLDRGRSYARRGQVLSIAINKGIVRAKVQGSRPSPYQVTIKVKAL